MLVYKVTFVNNEILSCKHSEDVSIEIKGKYTYEHHNGYLIHAFVKAENEPDARKAAQKIIKEFVKKQ